MSHAVQREERRIRRVFERALLVALAAQASCVPLGPDDVAGDDGDVGEAESALVSEAESASCAPALYTPDPPDTCGKFIHLACGLPAAIKPVANCYLWLNDCKKICPGAYFNCHATERSCVDGKIVPDDHGVVDIDCVTCAKGIGRAPAGLWPSRRASSGSAIGDVLAEAGHLEAASIHAFRRLAKDLAQHGAPASLVRAARDAARDEVRHARSMGHVARRFGGEPAAVHIDPPRERPFDEIALENAVEGCVRETYGALVAAFQAARAEDPEIANLMHTIADDEARHAALSWAVARWADTHLDSEARAAISAQCREAVNALRREAEALVPEDLRAALGMPCGDEQRLLIDMLEERLWADQRPRTFFA